jgi:peptidoglycan/xylan/chitin deacetylase (PgdA/CDA1 family)
MNATRNLLLSARNYAVWPFRQAARAGRCARRQEPVQILFYHRVADQHPNGWTMPTATFARQVAWLQRRFDIVGLAEAQQRIASGGNDRPTVCLTFDDGYADNLHFAIPLLLERKIPFTYFVCSDNVRKRRPFPHDVAAGVPLEVHTAEQVRQLAAHGVEIGAHTRTHADLGKLEGAELIREILGSKRELERIIGGPVRYFAFPYGMHANMSREAFQVARREGFTGVCSAYGGYNFPGEDPFHLQRIHADCEMSRFYNWLSVDPRKRRRVRPFSWKDQPHVCAPDAALPAGATTEPFPVAIDESGN